MNPATLTTSTFTLVQQGQTTPLPATVSYSSQVATLDPNANLTANTTYTATVKGGASGARTSPATRSPPTSRWTLHDGGRHEPAAGAGDRHARRIAHLEGRRHRSRSPGTPPIPSRERCPHPRCRGTLLLQHCPSNCHTHTVQTWPGVAGGSFAAPDHEYPSYLELELTATDGGGSEHHDRRAGSIRRRSCSPSPRRRRAPALASTAARSATPFTRTVIVGSSNSLSAPSPQSLGGTTYDVLVLVGRRRADAQHRRPGDCDDLHRDVHRRPRGADDHLPLRPHLDLGHQRLGPGGEGRVQRRVGRRRRQHADAERHDLREGPRRACGLGRALRAPADCTRFKAAVGVDDEVGRERLGRRSRCSRARPRSSTRVS